MPLLRLEYRASVVVVLPSMTWTLRVSCAVLVVNGPFVEQNDPSYRGMSIFACDAAEAARLSDGDPSVAAGRLSYDVLEWWVRAGSLAFPLADRPVGDRRSMPDN